MSGADGVEDIVAGNLGSFWNSVCRTKVGGKSKVDKALRSNCEIAKLGFRAAYIDFPQILLFRHNPGTSKPKRPTSPPFLAKTQAKTLATINQTRFRRWRQLANNSQNFKQTPRLPTVHSVFVSGVS